MASTSSNPARQSYVTSHDRKLRYRELLEDLSVLDDDIPNGQRIDKTSLVVKEAEALQEEGGGLEERAKHPSEGYLDSRVLKATSDMAMRCTEAASGNVNNYDKHTLAAHIRDYPEFWVTMFPGEVPPVTYLHGTFAPTPPEQRPRAPRRRLERQQAGQLKAPETVDRLDKIEEGSEMVSRVHRYICKQYKTNGQMPISYFHLVLDPSSFSRTVENIYHVSFLAKDGMLSVQLDQEYELPFIVPLVKQAEQPDIADEKQFIVSIDMKRWQELVEAFNIKEPMMVLKR